jgi:endonuclease/exonuclease/phosphatase family metal-dependent hydrolase
VGVGRDDGISQGEHMCIFYNKLRFEKLGDGNFWLSPTPDKPGLGWDAACNRTCTWIKLKDRVTKKTFFFFNTHLDHRGVTARLEGARLILTKMAEINQQNLPLILTGDFNAVKTSDPVKEVMKVLKDSREMCQTKPYGMEGSSGGFDVKLMPRIIDYIFINEKVTVMRHGILSDSFGLFYPSDHLPVLAEITF